VINRLGPYQVEGVLGRGGMGAVYSGMGESGERVALKILQPDLADNENFRERFQAEIESLKKLRHPRIVQLFGYGEQDGNLFYAMELVDGGSLQDELSRGRRFHWRDVTRIAAEICQALKHAHDHGVIHRDLKPANLLLDRQESVKLTDFGIAKLFGARSQTAQGGVMGTADYMAPEQAEGLPATARCDLYSLGCVMFTLLAGHPPFRGKSMAEVVHQLRYAEPPRVRNLVWDVPQALDEIIDQLLRKDPQQRIPTALALGNRLQALERSLSVGPETVNVPASSDEPPGATRLLPTAPDARVSLVIDAELAAQATAAMTHEDSPPIVSARGTKPTGTKPLDLATEPNGTRFTTVDVTHDKGRSTDEATEPGPWLLVFVTTLLIVVAVTGGVYFWNHQPSADALYRVIARAAESGNESALNQVETQTELFLQDHSDDPRYAEVAALHEEIQLGKLKRVLEAKSHRRKEMQEMTAVERAYLEAIRLAADQPEVAAQHLRSLVDLYSGAALDSVDATRCLLLARKKLETLESQLSDRQRRDLPILKKRLQDASEFDATDPNRAREIRAALIDLYHDKPWAADIVQQARSELQASEKDL